VVFNEESNMVNGPGIQSLARAAGVVFVAWGMAGAAQARDVVWSVGIGSPGVHVGVGNAPQVVHARPIVVAPQPVYMYRPPVVVHPRPMVRHSPPVAVLAPQTYYYAPSGWVPHGYRKGWRERRDERHDRWDRWDDRRGGRFDYHDHR
jgi:hypothetical protein